MHARTCDIAQALGLVVDPDDGGILQPNGHQTLPQESGTIGKHQIPQLPQPVAAIGHQVPIENAVVVKDYSEGVSPDVDLPGFALLVDDFSELAEALFFVEEEECLDLDAVTAVLVHVLLT